ncbi:hypothetical protein L3Q82_005911 [Scortum barcoo]|uniref:Uncharacterized protein n=1 Tax=Scortum barcoo TaxID=214431 RepID=A0ACB8VA08_9TELE|nr:hypothetical protein L3Q82_005911 [Scortum barcoo]
MSLLQSIVHTCLKKTIVIPMKPRTLCPNDYHQVALISTIKKCFERLIRAFITSFLTDSLALLQFASRPNRLRRLNMDARILCRCTIENLLTGCITTWYGNCTALN